MVLEAISKTNTPWKKYISRSSLRVKVFLCALLLLKKSGKVEIEFKDVSDVNYLYYLLYRKERSLNNINL